MFWNEDLYRINTDGIEFQTRVNKLITLPESNSLKNHIFKSNKGGDGTVRGEFKEGKFTLWRTNKTWSGNFYPIFKGYHFKINEMDVLEIKTRFNPFAEIIVLVISIVLAYGIITGIIIQSDNEFRFLLRRSVIGIVLFIIFQSVPIFSYYNSKNQTLKEFEKYFNLTRMKINKKKQY
jgi:hypothetical protein